MTTPDRSDIFDDLDEQRRQLEAKAERLREEARTATPARRTEIGWCLFGMTKWRGKLADVTLARRFGEHRFIIHELEDGVAWAVCSCGARFRGQMHVDFSLAEFPGLPGHVAGTTDPSRTADEEGTR